MPPFMGGMEAHCYSLVKALQARGHRVTLFAAGNCGLPGSVAICDWPYEEVYPWAQWRGSPELAEFQRRVFTRAWDDIVSGGFDVVHNNSLYPEIMHWAGRDRIAMLTSQHVPPFGAMHLAVAGALACSNQRVSVTSYHQKHLWGRSIAPKLDVVYNGVDPEQWTPVETRSERLLWFGRITPNKGLREAVAAAALAGEGLDILGTIEDRSYFAEHVEPLLNDRIVYHGHLSGVELQQRVAEARAVVVTPMWDEPFGLVAAESLASGVPVIAFDRGALREVIGDCGILVPSGDVVALAKAMSRKVEPMSAACRQRAEERFSLDAMVANYERCYAAAMRGENRQAA